MNPTPDAVPDPDEALSTPEGDQGSPQNAAPSALGSVQGDAEGEDTGEASVFDPDDQLFNDILDQASDPKTGVEALLRGQERHQWLKDNLEEYESYRGGADYSVKYAHKGYGSDFMTISNYQYLDKRYDFLSSTHGGIGIEWEWERDETEENAQRRFWMELAAIDEGDWESFTDDVEGLEGYPVLDEDLMSQLEMEALDEWMESDGIKEFKKWAAKQEALANSFYQFAASRVTVGGLWEILRDSDYETQTENDYAWIDLDRALRNLEPENLLVDSKGRDIEGRLRQAFLRYKKYAWNIYIRDSFIAQAEGTLLNHPDLLAQFGRLSEAQLFRLFLQAVPDDAYGDAETPSWYLDDEFWDEPDPDHPERMLKRSREYWVPGFGDNDSIDEVIQWAATEWLLEHLPTFGSVEAAQDPRQTKLPGFESQAAQAARPLVEDGLEDDDAVDQLFRSTVDRHYEVLVQQESGTLFEAHTQQGLALLTEQTPGLARAVSRAYLPEERVFVFCYSPGHEAEMAKVPNGRPAAKQEALEGDSSVGAALRQYVAQELAKGEAANEDRDWLLAVLFSLGGAEALVPFLEELNSGVLPGSSDVALGISFGVAGRLDRAKEFLRAKNVYVRSQGIWILVDDWSDLADRVGTGHRNNVSSSYVADMLSGDGFEYFDRDYRPSVGEVTWALRGEEPYALLRSKLVYRELTDPDCLEVLDAEEEEAVLLTPERVERLVPTQIDNLLKAGKHSDLEDLAEAVSRAADDAERMGSEAASLKYIQESITEAMGVKETKWFRVWGSKRHQFKLGLFISWKQLESALKWALENTDWEDYDDNSVADLILNFTEKARVYTDDNQSDFDQEAFNELLRDALNEIKDQEPPPSENPGQEPPTAEPPTEPDPLGVPDPGQPLREAVDGAEAVDDEDDDFLSLVNAVEDTWYSQVGQGPQGALFRLKDPQTLPLFFGHLPADELRELRQLWDAYDFYAFRVDPGQVEASAILVSGSTVYPEGLPDDIKALMGPYILDRLRQALEGSEEDPAPLVAVLTQTHLDPDEALASLNLEGGYSDLGRLFQGIAKGRAGDLATSAKLLKVPREWLSTDGILFRVPGLEYFQVLFESPQFFRAVLNKNVSGYYGQYPYSPDFSDYLELLDTHHFHVLRRYTLVGLPEDADRVPGTDPVRQDSVPLTREFLDTLNDDDLKKLLLRHEEDRAYEDVVASIKVSVDQLFQRFLPEFYFESALENINLELPGSLHPMDGGYAFLASWESVQRAFLTAAGKDRVQEGMSALEMMRASVELDWEDRIELPDPHQIRRNLTKAQVNDELLDVLKSLGPHAPPEDPHQMKLALESQRRFVEGYDFACLMVKVPKEQADFIQGWSRQHIPDEWLTDKENEGREDDCHITVKWGIQVSQPDGRLRQVVGATKAFPVHFGKISLFRNGTADVVKLDIESPWLRALHARVKASVPNQETHPSYIPHCTLAYVKPGTADALEGQEVFGQSGAPAATFYVYDLVFKAPGEKDDPHRETLLTLPRSGAVSPETEEEEEPQLVEARSVDPFAELDFPAEAARLPGFKKRKKRKKAVLS